MRYVIQLTVQGDDVEPHTLRDLAARAVEGAGGKVTSSHCAHASKQFVVHGVDTASAEPFSELVEAAHADEAREKAATARRIVAHVAAAE